MRRSILIVVLGVVALLPGLAGCELWQEAPKLAHQPPRISELSVVPESVPAGTQATVQLSFRYEDPDGDVGPESAEVEIRADVLSGNLKVDKPLSRVLGIVQMDERQAGHTGLVELIWTLEIPPAAYGLLRLSVTLFDRAGQRSNSLSGELTVGAGGKLGGACTFLDGDGNPVTAYRVGRQVFFRVSDPDNDTSRNLQDILYNAASVQAGATGDTETISMMVETGPNTGVFEGPVGGLPLVSQPSEPADGALFVVDQDTIIAIYQDPNDPGDVCIALAEIR